MALTKPRGGWRYEHLPELPEGVRYEIIDGELYEMPAPTVAHAIVIANLFPILAVLAAARGGRLWTAPVDVFLGSGRPVQPDIFYIGPAWRRMRTPEGIAGVPELIVEVLRPSNRDYDQVTKRELYERAGAPEYWLVDIENRSIEVLALRGGRYELLVRAGGDEAVHSAVFPELGFPAARAFVDAEAEG